MGWYFEYVKPSNLAYFAVLACIMAVLPFGEQPHLWQKLLLLKNGYLHKPMDWFDLFLHGGPLAVVSLVLFWRFWQRLRQKRRNNSIG